MNSFEIAVRYVLENEGVDSNDAADSGGRTRFGITHDEALMYGYDVTKLTLDQAKGIYLNYYWNTAKLDAVVSQRIATKLLDMRVNMGKETAVMIAQKALGLRSDGIVGPATLQAINTNSATEGEIVWRLAAGCVPRYTEIVIHKPDQLVFLRGWINRVLKVPQ